MRNTFDDPRLTGQQISTELQTTSKLHQSCTCDESKKVYQLETQYVQ